MIRNLEKYALENKIPIIEKEGKEFLENYIKENEILNILEIGSAIGYSAIVMAQLCKDIHVTTIERDEVRYNEAIININKANLDNQIDIYLADALEFDVSKINRQYDLLFIDAAKAQYRNFFEKYISLLNDNGIVIVDNIDFHGFVTGKRKTMNRNTKQLVRKINEFKSWIFDNKKYSVEYLNIGDGIFIIKSIN